MLQTFALLWLANRFKVFSLVKRATVEPRHCVCWRNHYCL